MTNPLYVAYHDYEWGVPVHNDRNLFEMFLLETFQAGLSWECILNKREAFRKGFDDFDYERIALYDENKLQSLQQDKSIIRNRLKIKAAVTNAQVFMRIQKECGSFDRYIWSFTDGNTVFETGLATSPLSDSISRELRKKGMKFVGSTVIYAYLQAVGIINSHEEGCWLAKREQEQ
ncbi:MAG: DNA-3-methyladenine glycosylase I [Bacteroidaceae bacterium]|jgi:DNA-3-methyladenine glycosylase I